MKILRLTAQDDITLGTPGIASTLLNLPHDARHAPPRQQPIRDHDRLVAQPGHHNALAIQGAAIGKLRNLA